MPATSLLITSREMRAARERGDAWPLCPAIPEFTRWYGEWWLLSADGWLRITDSHLASRLDRIKARLDVAEQQRACYLALCRSDSAVGTTKEGHHEEEIWPAR